MIITIRKLLTIGVACAFTFIAGCGATNPPEQSKGHIGVEPVEQAKIPEPVIAAPVLPRPDPRPNLETYTVIVNQVPVRELLFSMARDAKLNLDIDNSIEGRVTMNAIDQTLPQILDRLTKQVEITYRIEDETLRVMADEPYLMYYDVNYLNMSRISEGSVEVSSEISSTGAGAQGESGGSGGGGSKGGNDSSSIVTNKSRNLFWPTLAVNIAAILGEEATYDDDEFETSTNIIVNRETGFIGVRATSKHHAQIREWLDKVVGSSQRQVLIEATLAEVQLSDTYQAGIDWSVVSSVDAITGAITEGVSQQVLAGNLGNPPFFQVSGLSTSGSNELSATLKALETFGDVKVLSSPKIMAINNQSAILKVVDNEVYFSVEVTPATVIDNVFNPAVIDTDINTVPVGFVMSVMPYVDANDVVTLHVRPTISRIIGTADDPNPALADAGVTSEIPIIQVREVESVLKVESGDTAVIGGLMQDQINKSQSGIPLLMSIPWLGGLFSYTEEEFVKSELVIFIRPVVIHDASLTGDLKDFNQYYATELENDIGDRDAGDSE